MSRLIARILLTVLLFPAATLLYFVSFLLIDRLTFLDSETSAIFATVATCAFMAGYWLLLWFWSVTWTRRRTGRTLWSVGIGVFGGGVIGAAVRYALNYDQMVGTCLGMVCATIIWMIATVFVWRETEAERA